MTCTVYMSFIWLLLYIVEPSTSKDTLGPAILSLVHVYMQDDTILGVESIMKYNFEYMYMYMYIVYGKYSLVVPGPKFHLYRITNVYNYILYTCICTQEPIIHLVCVLVCVFLLWAPDVHYSSKYSRLTNSVIQLFFEVHVDKFL